MNYPYAVLHAYKTGNFKSASDYAKKVAKLPITDTEARNYTRDVIRTNGQPHLIDIVEREEAEQRARFERRL